MKEQSGKRAWLRPHPYPRTQGRGREDYQAWRRLLGHIEVEGCEATELPVPRALEELHATLRISLLLDTQAVFVKAGRPPVSPEPGLPNAESWKILALADGGVRISVAGPHGFLRAVFTLLSLLGQDAPPPPGPVVLEAPEPPLGLRMLDHWDNMDGSIERGYAGTSIFFRRNRIPLSRPWLDRIDAYARLLASVGVNAVCINNVNVHHHESWLITERHRPALETLAGIFRSWGIRLWLCANFASPITLGSHPVADPEDPAVAQFWKEKIDALYARIPDFGGLVVKADSEGRPGPFTYGRTHASGANMLARALAPHGGILFWRCFVYNCQQDWRDRKTDRARAAYDHFTPLDGQFLPNVVLQIKNGPMDFQVREAVSPLFGGLKATKMALEVQVTQEYTGQQRHVCYLGPWWREVLDFPNPEPVARQVRAMVGVANVGSDANWTGHHLAQANLYAFGRLSLDPGADPAAIAREWVCLTFGSAAALTEEIGGILDRSWPTYEAYTAPLGVGWMVNPNHHYGPSVDGYEYSRWGTYHHADQAGMGMDRTRATGTGYSGQYHEPWRTLYEDPARCPEELLLFFHHVPWTRKLRSGTTMIQHIYDTHFAGVEEVEDFIRRWDRLRDQIDPRRHREVKIRLEDQLASAREWCDQINTYCWRKTGIPDGKGRLIHP